MMKKIYLFFLLALTAMVCHANEITLTVKADPSVFTQIQIGTNDDITQNAASTFMQFSEEGIANTVSYTGTFAYMKVSISGTAKYTVKAYKADGSLGTTLATNKTGTGYFLFMGIGNYDGGTVVIENAAATKEYIYVTIEGDVNKVYMDQAGTRVNDLTLGQNKIELKGKIVNFKAIGGEQFYQLLYNGYPKNPTYDAAEGSGVYNYLFTSVKANDTFYINTEYPDINYAVNIITPDDDFISQVLVNGTAVEDWKNLQVKAGDKVRVVTDYDNYFVNSVLINGEEPAGFSGAYEKAAMDGDLTLTFDVVKPTRDQVLSISWPSPLGLDVYNKFNGKLFTTTSQGGTTTIEYDLYELPLTIFSDSQSSSELTQLRVAELNGTKIAQKFYTVKLDTDVLSGTGNDNLAITLVDSKFTVICADPTHVVMTLYGTETEIKSGTPVKTKDAQDINSITFQAVEGYEIYSMLVDGQEQIGGEYDHDGLFVFTPDGLVTYEVLVRELPKTITLGQAAQLGANETATVSVTDAKVTYVAENGTYFIEDATGALQVVEANWEVAQTLNGTFDIMAYDFGGGMFFYVVIDASGVTATDGADIDLGSKLTVAEALAAENRYRLVTFTAEDGHTFELTTTGVIIDGTLQVTTLLNEDLEDYIDEIQGRTVTSVTGIMYMLPGVGGQLPDDEANNAANVYLCPRVEDDIVTELPTTITINVNIAAALPFGGFVFFGEDGEEYVQLHDGDNEIDLTELEVYDPLLFGTMPGSTYYVSAVTHNGENALYGADGMYAVYDIQGGDVIVITMAEKIRDREATIMINGVSDGNLINPYVTEYTRNEAVATYNDSFFLPDGYHTITFHNDDNPICFNAERNFAGNLYVYVNDDLVEDIINNCNAQFELAHGDVVKVYAQEEQPEPVIIIFNVFDSDAVPNVTVDYGRQPMWFDINELSLFSEEPSVSVKSHVTAVLPGTHVEIHAPAGETVNDIAVNGNVLTKDEEGNFSFVATPNATGGFSHVNVYANAVDVTAIENITINANAPVEYFNLQGVRVAEPTPGVYIMRQGNNVNKVIIK